MWWILSRIRSRAGHRRSHSSKSNARALVQHSRVLILSPYVVQTNPDHYSNLSGPVSWDIDATLMKQFSITEPFRAELRAEAYNLTNRLNLANPDTVLTDSTFGQALRQSNATVGRQVEPGMKIIL